MSSIFSQLFENQHSHGCISRDLLTGPNVIASRIQGSLDYEA